MGNYQKWNKILGWIVFAIALVVYSITVEPTASFWDVGEYIATSSKLQVGHPPGAPLFQMIGAVASLFASSPQNIAWAVNMTSCFASALTVAILFWTISLLLYGVYQNNNNTTSDSEAANLKVVFSSAFIGSLGFAFTDSFWFNAVEAEVYAMATCILGLLFYLGLLWYRDMFLPRGDKWLVLLFFIIGLSFGVHFMGLLSIPAIGMLYYFKNYANRITLKSFLLANVISASVLLFIFKLLLPNVLRLFSVLEIFFVNQLRMPFHSGTIFTGILLASGFYWGLNYTKKQGLVHYNTILLCVVFLMIGFSSWLMLPIRANSQTVINENNPNNARELLAYYNLEQYPETHLFYGPQFSEIYSGLDPVKPYVDDKKKFERNFVTHRYEVVNDWQSTKQNPDRAHNALLPRMWSSEHAVNYMRFTGMLPFSIRPEYQGNKELQMVVLDLEQKVQQGLIGYEEYHSFLRKFSDQIIVQKPSFMANIYFMIRYQFVYMYWRYFMWNFVGRQDDIEGKMRRTHGNWLSGINSIDSIRLGSQEMLPTDVLNNKARNTYYFLPLLLGIIGFLFQWKKDTNFTWVVMLFFLFTGLILKVYLNERPFEPRERDYALVGSFYAFAIWMGMGVYGLYEYLKKHLSVKVNTVFCSTIGLLCAPYILIANNWDDHDRSGRYTAQAMAKMYLQSCQKNAIIFTIGDNDTFALWYAQEIEGYRTDVRTINTSLIATDWYIDQSKRAVYESKPIKTEFQHEFYKVGNNDIIFYQPLKEKDTSSISIKTWIAYIKSDNPSTKGELRSGRSINTFPSKNIRVPVNRENVLKSGVVAQKDADLILPYIDIKLNTTTLTKNRLIMLDMLANNDWERPIYFTGGSYNDADFMWLKDYLQLDGMTYKLVPIRTKLEDNISFDMGRIDTDLMYNNVMSWDWGNSSSKDIYHDPETRKNGISYRSNLIRLVDALIGEDKKDKAKKVLDLAMEQMPVDYYGFYTILFPYVEAYYKVGDKQKARGLWQQIAKKYQESLEYYISLGPQGQLGFSEDILMDSERYTWLVDVLVESGAEDLDYIDIEKQKLEGYLGTLARQFSEFRREYSSAFLEQEDTDQVNDSIDINFTDKRVLDSVISRAIEVETSSAQ